MTDALGFEVRLTMVHEAAIAYVTQALKAEGFGILSRIEIHKAFREKIGEEFRPYTILGACNPKLAHVALSSKPELGLMLPCNLTVEANGEGSIVRIINPAVMMQVGELGSDAAVVGVAKEATARLKRVAAALIGEIKNS